MIEIAGLSKIFNEGRANEVVGLHNVNLRIDKGDFIVVVGANGSGKSTLMNCIAGSIFPSKGHIRFDGTDVTHLPEYKRNRWVARVFQNPLNGTAPELSILENFRLAALRTSAKSLRIGIDEAFKRKVKYEIATLGMGLENRLGQPMGALSGGQRQALALLMCVMDDLSILLLDEPTAALDPRSADLVLKTADQIIKQHQLTALLITHNIKDASLYGNRLIQMEDGRIVKDISSELKKKLTASDIYSWFG